MAKRRKLEAPSAEDIGKIEAEFRHETPGRRSAPPIAQIAGDAASAFEPETTASRRDIAQAAALREAEEQGRLIRDIPLEEIDIASLQRDRTLIDPEALGELEHSIEAHGLRLPVEVYVLPTSRGALKYGLLSGYRRYIAIRNLWSERRETTYSTIKALVRNPEDIGGAFVAMVEENEIRQDLSHYERGRIAVIATQQGVFASVEAAVGQMFAAASKAKRSKIRSFAVIFEELGDVLQFPEALREKDGLQLVKALRSGAADALRSGLAQGEVDDARAEWALIQRVLDQGPAETLVAARGGRPRRAQVTGGVPALDGMQVTAERKGQDCVIRLSGSKISDQVLARAVEAVVGALATDPKP